MGAAYHTGQQLTATKFILFINPWLRVVAARQNDRKWNDHSESSLGRDGACCEAGEELGMAAGEKQHVEPGHL